MTDQAAVFDAIRQDLVQAASTEIEAAQRASRNLRRRLLPLPIVAVGLCVTSFAAAQVSDFNPLGVPWPHFAQPESASVNVSYADADGSWSITAYRSSEQLLCISQASSSDRKADGLGCENGFVLADDLAHDAPVTYATRPDGEHTIVYGVAPASATSLVFTASGQSATAALSADTLTIPIPTDGDALTPSGAAFRTTLPDTLAVRPYVVRVRSSSASAAERHVAITLTLSDNTQRSAELLVPGTGGAG